MCHSQDSLPKDRIHRLRDRQTINELKVFGGTIPCSAQLSLPSLCRNPPPLEYAGDGHRGIARTAATQSHSNTEPLISSPLCCHVGCWGRQHRQRRTPAAISACRAYW